MLLSFVVIGCPDVDGGLAVVRVKLLAVAPATAMITAAGTPRLIRAVVVLGIGGLHAA